MSNDFLTDVAPPDETRTLMDVHEEEVWRKARVGCATGSRIFDIIARTKAGKYTAERGHYLNQLSNERLTGVSQEKVFSVLPPAMAWGVEQEKNAVSIYALESPETVVPLSKVFIPHPRIFYAGCSPDALVGDRGGLEVKCPETETHKRFLRSGLVPDEYLPQVVWCMICTERDWWDFMSFDPRCPEHMRKRVARIHRDDTVVANLEKAVSEFLYEVDEDVRYWREWRL